MQLENRLAIRPDHVDVLGGMVIGVNDHPETIEPQNRGHVIVYQKPKRLGITQPLALAGDFVNLVTSYGLRRERSRGGCHSINATSGDRQ
jgi:hypothetical protein